MSVSIVAKRYAKAIMELGAESGQLEALAGDLGRVSALVEEQPELRAALENPLVNHAAKKAVLTEVATRLGTSQLARNALGFLVDRRRILALPYIAKELRALTDAQKGLVRAVVTTAAPLTEPYFAKLQAQLERMTGKTVVLERHIDPSIIAGVVTRIGDRVFDGSLRTRLASLRDVMMPT